MGSTKHLSRFNLRAIDDGCFLTNPAFDLQTKDRGRTGGRQALLSEKTLRRKVSLDKTLC
jgi:hypothetical protein